MKTQLISKNTYGYSVSLQMPQEKIQNMFPYTGSSLNRKKTENKSIAIPLSDETEIKPKVLRSMSQRTKSKIKKKLIALSRLMNTLTFVTLTFCNIVEDKQAVKMLKNFLDYAKKVYPQFEYLWVAERQAKNKSFPDNIHFHLVTTIQWDIKKFWYYWLRLQKKYAIIPREENYKPSSAFDVRYINMKDMKKLQGYVTKYITKNKSEFDCQVWNCSKKVSALYTDIYSDFDFILRMEKLIGEPLKSYSQDYCTIYSIPLDERTIKEFYLLEKINKENWSK